MRVDRRWSRNKGLKLDRRRQKEWSAGLNQPLVGGSREGDIPAGMISRVTGYWSGEMESGSSSITGECLSTGDRGLDGEARLKIEP